MAEVLTASKEASDNAVLGQKVQSILDEHGGTELLLQKYEEIAAYNTNNHLPLVWRFYSAHRKTLFELIRSLDIHSTEFKTGDACVVGSESYADFRAQLLTQSECEPLLEEYCQQLGFPQDAEGFVAYLQQELTRVAESRENIFRKLMN